MIQMIAYSTAADTKDIEFIKSSIPAALVLDVAAGWAGTETIPVYYVGHDGIRQTPVLNAAGADFAFSTTVKVLNIEFPCKIRLIKPVTVAPVGVNLLG